jgi:low affinity Fe/Cu permease
MVFVIQTSQNRESKAIQLKLDELILSNERARNQVILADKDSEEELAELEAGFDEVADEVPNALRRAPTAASPVKPNTGKAPR